MKSTLIVVVVVGLVLVGGLAYKCVADDAAWRKAEDALIRVRSGLKFEAVLQVRPDLANADAVIAEYSSTTRLIPLHHADRLKDATKAISFLGEAVDWTTKDTSVNENDLRAVAADAPEVIGFISSHCSEGHLTVASSSVSSAFVILGSILLEGAIDGSKPIRLPARFNIESAVANCRQQAIQDRATAENRYWASFRYRVDVSLANSTATACMFDLTIDGDEHSEETLHPGPGFEYGVRRSMRLDSARCDGSGASPSIAIQFKVNGHPTAVSWTDDHATVLR